MLNVYLSDVIERNNIQNDSELQTLIEIISSSIGSLTNPLKLSRTFKSNNSKSTITDKTIYNYLTYLQEDFLIEETKRYDVKEKNILILLKNIILQI